MNAQQKLTYQEIAPTPNKTVDKTFSFDSAAYRRLRLPWLLFSLIPSLAVDGILIYFWQAGLQSMRTQEIWLVIFEFLFIINQLFFKGFIIHRYLHIKNVRAMSFVRVERSKVVHYQFLSCMSRRRVRMALETSLSDDNKQEYIAADTFHIRKVERLCRRPDGSIEIEGAIDKESLDEVMQEFYDTERLKTNIKEHKIIAYYHGMDEIFRALESLQHR